MTPAPALPKARKRQAPARPQAALRRHALRPGLRPVLRPISLAVCLLGAAPVSFGLPTGAVQTSGQTTLSQTRPGQLDILQSTQRASLDWTSFSIAASERVNVVQPDRSSILLNRVVGDNPSLIYGSLQSNGSVWLINPRGIVFGASSRVDVGGLVASTLVISKDALASGRIQLGAGSDGAGELRSEGHITAIDGTVALVSPQLMHSGQITARRVGLAAASEVLVDVEGDGLVFFQVRNDRLDARLALMGGVRADGGTADIRAAARSGFADTVLNLDGVVQARSIGTREGRIVVDGGANGVTRVAGTLDASGGEGRGGSVQVLGERVRLAASAALDVSGAAGGGSVLVGGDYQGHNAAVRNAAQTIVEHGAVLNANATAQGDGGRVIVWSDDTTVFDGRATATGGARGGNGGFVETSGKLQLGVQHGSVDVSAPAGVGGQWLLDPANIIVANGGGAAIGDVDNASVLPGTLQTVAPATLVAVGGNVTLAATSSITVNNDVALTAPGAGLTLRAGNRIDLNANLGTNNGPITLSTGAGGLGQLTAITVNAGNSTIAINGGGGSVTMNGRLQTSNISASAIVISSTADLQLGNVATGGAAGAIELSFSGTGTQAAGTSITAGKLVKQGGGTLVLNSAGNTYTGGSDIELGVLRISGAGVAGSGAIAVNAQTLDVAGGASVGNALTLSDNATLTSSTGGGTLAAGTALNIGNNDTLNLSSSGGGTLAIARVIGDTGTGDVVIGGGTVALQAVNTYRGTTTVSAGTLRIDGATANAGSGNVVLGNRTLDIAGGANFVRPVSFTDGASFTSSTGDGTLGGGIALAIPNGVGINLSSGAGSTLTVARVISDGGNNDGTVTVTSGNVELTANNTFLGGTTINGGTLRVAGAGADAGDSSIVLLSGALDITGGATVIRAVTASSGAAISSSTGGGTLGGAGTLTLADGATLNLAGGAASTLVIDRVIAAAAGVGLESISVTNGTVLLKQDNSYTGTTTVGALATLVAGDGAAAGSVGSGHITLGAGATLRIDRTGSVTLAQNILGATVGDGTLSKINTGTLVLTGTNSYGATSITGGTLQVGSNGANGSLGSLGSGPVTLASPGALNINRTGLLTIAGAFSGDGTFTQAGTGTSELTGNSSASFTGAVNVTGGTLRLSGASASVGTGTITLGANTLDIAGGASVANDISIANTGSITSSSGNGTLAAGTALNLGAAVGITLAGGAGSALTVQRVIADTANDATVAVSTGTVVLRGLNSYDGGTTLAGGSTLRLDNTTAGSGNIAVGAGTLDLTAGASVANTLTIGNGGSITSSSGGGTLAAGAALSLGNNVAITLGGAAGSTLVVARGITDTNGNGALNVSGGTVALNADNSFGGNTAIGASTTLVLGNGGATGTLGGGDISIGNAAVLQVNRDNISALALTGVISGTGSLALSGGGTTALSADNSYSGGTTLTNGTLRITGALASAGSGTIALGANTLDIAGNANVTAALTVNSGASITSSSGSGTLGAGPALSLGNAANLTLSSSAGGTLTVGRAITDVASDARLVVAAGTVALQGTNSYGGGTTVSSGTLRIDGLTATAGAAGGGIALGANTLDIASGANVNNPLTVASGASITNSAGTGTLGAGPALSLGNAANLTLSSSAGGTLTVGRAITDVASDARLVVAAGTVALQGTNSYGGGTTVSSGTLRIDGLTATAGAAGGGIALGANTLDIASGANVNNPLTVASGASITNSAGTGTLGGASTLTLPDASTLNLSSAGTSLTVTRDIADTNNNATVALLFGNVLLLGNNSFGGDINVTAGTLRLNGAGATLGDGVINLGANTLDISGGASLPNVVTIADGGTITSSSGSGTLAANATPLTLPASATLTLSSGGGGTLTLARVITDGAGSANLNVSAGTVALTANNSVDGSTAIGASTTLVVGNGGNAGTPAGGNISIANAGVLQINRDNTSTVLLTSPISGNGSLLLTGGATAVLSADNSYSGGSTVSSGTLRITGATADAGSGTIALGANTLDITGGASVSNTVTASNGASITSSSGGGTLAAGTALTLANAANLNLGSSGGGSLTVARSISDVANNATVTITGGAVALQGANSYDAGTAVNAGTLRISGAAASAGSGTIALGANTLDIADGANVPNVVALAGNASITNSSGAGTLANNATALTLGNGSTLTLSSAGSGLAIARVIDDGLSGSAGLNVAAGLVTLSTANTYDGGSTVASGATLRLANGTAAGSGAITLQGASSVLDITGGASVTNALNVVASGATVSNSSGTGTLAGGTLVLADTFNLNLDSTGSGLTLTRAVDDGAGNASLTSTGGSVTLAADNSYSGATTVGSGTLRITGALADAGSGAIALGANTLDISGGASVANAVSVANGATVRSSSGGGTLAAGSTLSLGNNVGLTLAGAAGSTLNVARSISDTSSNGSLSASGGNVVLTADNSYRGSTTIAVGATLAVGAGGAIGTLGSGAVTNAGVLRINRDASTNVTLAAAISGTGIVEQIGPGTTVLSADNAYGNTVVSAGVLQVGNGGATGTLGSGSITLASPGMLRVSRTGTLTIAGAFTGNGSFTQAGAGTAELTGDSSASFSGAVNVTGGTLRISGASASVGTGAIFLGANTLDIAGGASVANLITVADGATLGNSIGTGTLAANATPVALANASTLNLSSTGSGLAIDRILSDGLGSASVAVAGTAGVTLGAVNAYDGSTRVTSGTLTLAVNNALAASSAVIVDGGTLALGARNASVASVSLRSGAITGSTGVLTSASSFDLRAGSASAVLAGGVGVGLLKTTAGNVTISGANTYAGTTTVSGGSLVLGASNALPDTTAVTVNGGTLDLANRSDTVASLSLVAGTVAGSGTLTAASYSLAGGSVDANLGAGTLTGSGDVALNGTAGAAAVNINVGTLTLGAADRLANAAAVNVASGATLALGGADTVGTLALSGALAGTGTLTASTGYALNGGSTAAGADLGLGALASTGASSLGGRSAAVTVAVNGGTLTLGAADRLADIAAVTVAGTASLVLGGADTVGSLNLTGSLRGTGTLTAGGYTLNSGASTAGGANLGAGTLTVAGSSTLGGNAAAGTVNVNTGTLTLSSADQLADTAALAVASGATLALGGSDTVASLALSGTLGGTGTLTAGSYGLAAGAATLASANLGTGTLTVSGNSTLAGSAAASTVNVNAGTLSLAAADRLADTAVLSVAGGATLALGGNDTVASLALTGTLAGSGHTLSTTDRSTLQAGASVVANLGAGRMDVAGSATLSGSSGATTVNLNAGTLSLASGGRLASGATVTVSSGATLALGGAETVQTLDLSGSLSGATHKLGAQQYTLRSGAQVNAKLGTGQLDVQGDATLAGTADAQIVNVNAGTFVLASGDLLADNADVTVLGPATLTLTGSDTIGSLALSGTVNGTGTLNAGTYVLNEGNYDLGLGTGNLTSRGRSRLNGASAAAIVNVQTGTLTLGSPGRFTALPAVTVSSGATLNLGGAEAFGTLAGAGTVGLGTSILTTGSGGDSSFSGNLTGSGGLTKLGSGSFTLGGNNAYTGATLVQAGVLRLPGTLASTNLQVQAGAALVLEASHRLADNAVLTVAGGASFTLAGDDGIGSLNLLGTLNGSGTLSAATYALNGGNVVANLGAGTLDSLGSSRLQGSAAATQINVNGGTLTLVSANRLTGTPVTTVAAAARLDLGGDQTLGSLAGAGNVGLGSFTLSTGTAGDSRFDGVISGAGGLVKNGASSFVLGGANLYSGTTHVAAGTLATAAADVLPDTSAVTVAPGATLMLGGNDGVASLALLGTFAGSGRLSAASYSLDGGTVNAELGTGTLSSVGSSSLAAPVAAGAVNVSAGTLTLVGSNLLADNATLTVATGAALNLGGTDTVGSLVLAGTLGGAGTLTAATYTLASASVLANLGPGRIDSSGNTSLAGSAAARTVNVVAGTLGLASADRLADDASVSVARGATLALGGNDSVAGLSLAGTLAGSGRLSAATYALDGASVLADLGAGALSNVGSSSLAGLANASQVDVNAGTLTLAGADRLASLPAVTIAGGATLVLGDNQNLGSLAGAGELRLAGFNLSTGALADSRFDGVVSGRGTLSKLGNSVFTLGGRNTYDGTTRVLAGTLVTALANVLPDTSALSVATGATLQLGGNDTVATLALSGTLAGTGTLSAGSYTLNGGTALGATGTGVLTSSGNSTLTGTAAADRVTVSGGTLTVSATNRLADTALVSVATGATLALLGDDTITRIDLAGTLSGNGVLTAQTYALDNGRVDAALGSGALSSSGASQLNSRSNVGSVSINDGSLTLGSAQRLAATPALSVAAGATLVMAGDETLGSLAGSGGIALGNATLRSGAGGDSLFDGTLSGAGSFTKQGASTFTLAGNQAYSGATRIEGGTLMLTGTLVSTALLVEAGTLALAAADRLADTATVGVTSGAALTLAGAETIGTLNLSGTLGGNGTLTAASYALAGGLASADLGTGALSSTGASRLNGTAAVTTVAVGGGTFTLGAAERLTAAPAVNIAAAATLALVGDQTLGTLAGSGAVDLASFTLRTGVAGDSRFDGVLTGTGGLGKQGGGTFTLGGANLYSGATRVDAGTLALAGAERLPDNSTTSVAAGATLALNGNETVGSLTLAGTLNGNGTLSAASYVLDSGTAATPLGTGALTSIGSSTLAGTAAAGSVQVTSGTLLLAAADRLTALPAVTVAAGGTLDLAGNQRLGTLAGTGSVALNSFTLATGQAGDSNFAGNLAGTGGLVKQGASSFTLSGASTYTGATQVEGGTLSVGGTLLTGNVQVNAGTLALTAAERLADSATVAVASGATLTLAGTETVASLALAGTLNGSGTLTAAAYTLASGTVLADLGSGTLTSNGASTLAGSAAAAQVGVDSGTLTLASADRLADTAAVTVAAGATLALNNTDTVASLALAGTLAGSGTLTAGSTLLNSGTVNANLGTGALTSRGASTLAGNAAVSTVSIETGTLALASAQRFSALPAVQVNNAATLALSGDQAFGTLAGAGDVALASFTLSTGSGGDSVFAGAIGGSGGLIKQGSASTFTLTGANSYTGLTSVQAGTLRVGDGGGTGSLASSAYQLEGTLRMQRSDNVTLAAPVAGSGGVEQAGSGRLLFSGNNKTYTGNTTLTRGELATAGADELPDAAAVLVTADGRLTLGGRETVRAIDADGAITLGGDLSASGDLLMRGAVGAANAVQLSGQRIDAPNDGNRFGGAVSLDARGRITLSSGREAGIARGLVLGTVTAAAGGRIDAGITTLSADTTVTGSTLELVSSAAVKALAPQADLIGKQATALPLAFAEDAVLQGTAGRINVAAGAGLSITAGNGASVQLLRPDNVVLGTLSVISGTANTAWSPNATSLTLGTGAATNFAVQSRLRLNGTTLTVGGNGIVADVVSIRADRLATVGSAEIVARLPFDSAAGSVSSLPGLTLELTPDSYNLSFAFGGIGADAGLRVNVGSRAYGNRTLPLDAGFVTVLPRNGARGTTAVLLTGPVVNPAGGYRFFFDGAGSQTQIPVFYNGVLPTTPQVENSISATVSVSEGARKERFDEAVRTENVAVRLRAGVIAEVGPAPSATTGTEGLNMPPGCTPAAASLLCAKAP